MGEFHQPHAQALAQSYFAQLDSFVEKPRHRRRPRRAGVLRLRPRLHGLARDRAHQRLPGGEGLRQAFKPVPEGRSGRANINKSYFAFLDWNKHHRLLPHAFVQRHHDSREARNPEDTGIDPKPTTRRFRTKLIRDLEDLKDPATGERIITEIHKREDVFPGAAMGDAPDLQLVLRDFGFVSVRNILPVVQERNYIVGTHHPGRRVPRLRPGHREAGKLLGQRKIMDVASHAALQPGAGRAVRLRRRRAAERCSRPSTRSRTRSSIGDGHAQGRTRRL